jgi:hypothetical protein
MYRVKLGYVLDLLNLLPQFLHALTSGSPLGDGIEHQQVAPNQGFVPVTMQNNQHQKQDATHGCTVNFSPL